jgi:hypothetical protein
MQPVSRAHRHTSPTLSHVRHAEPLLTVPGIAAMAVHGTSTPYGPWHPNTFLSITAPSALSAEGGEPLRGIRNQGMADPSMPGGRQGAGAAPCGAPMAMPSQCLRHAKHRPLLRKVRVGPVLNQ